MSWWPWKKRNTKSDVPVFWQAYQQATTDPFPRKTPLEQLKFVVFDTETTGLDPKKDLILSIGALGIRHNQILVREVLEMYLHQEYVPMGESIEIHGILPHGEENKILEKEALATFLNYIGKSILVGHHVKFDIRMVDMALARFGNYKLKNHYVDTGRLAVRVEPRLGKIPGALSLDRLSERFGISTSDRHTAAGDAYITAILFLKLLARLERRGVRTLGDLLR